MSQNPYADPQEPGFDYYEEPRRTSLLAITALIFSLACCIPGVSTIGLVLGGVSFALVGASQGRVSGRGMALAAMIIGLGVTAIWGAIGFGAYSGYQYYAKTMAPVVDDTVIAMTAGDLTAVQARFTSGEDITAEQVARFVEIADSQIGQFSGVRVSFGDVMESFKKTYTGRSQGASINMQPTPNTVNVPMVLEGATGTLLCWPIFDENSINTGDLKMIDLLVQLPGFDAFSLRSSDVAKEVAIRLGSQLLGPDQMAAPPAPASVDPPVDESSAPDEPPF